MQLEMAPTLHRAPLRTAATQLLFTAALVLAASMAAPRVSAAAEVQLTGSGSFKPPTTAQLAALPTDLGFTSSDLASGSWSFSVRYDDSMRDAEPDPHAGRYAGAISAFRLVIGSTTVDLPVAQAQIVVSDGGNGFPNRESIRVETKALLPSGLLRLSWIQINQQDKSTDLRGAAGLLANDALPASPVLANLAAASPFDRYLELRIDRPGGDPKPLLYLSSSRLSVTAGPPTAH